MLPLALLGALGSSRAAAPVTTCDGKCEVFPMYGMPDPAYANGGPGVWHGKPGVVTLGSDIFAIGGISADCMVGLRRSSPPHGPSSFGAFHCAIPPRWHNGTCELRDGPVGIGDEREKRLVLLWDCVSAAAPFASSFEA